MELCTCVFTFVPSLFLGVVGKGGLGGGGLCLIVFAK